MRKALPDSPHSTMCGTPKSKLTVPIDILDDLSSRFVINLPQNEKTDKIRVMFQIEMAHWFYIDFHCCQRTDLVKFKLYPFAKLMIDHIPFLRTYSEDYQTLYEEWKEYKSNVPVYGAILLDKTMQYVLMVQGFSSYANWGFPKGKVNAEEDPVLCACREVKEETGFDCSKLISPKEYIDIKIRGSSVRLYIVPGLDISQNFVPQTRGEIRKIDWFRVDDLPSHRNDIKEGDAKTFFTAIPFIAPLRKWIASRKARMSRAPAYKPSSRTKNTITLNKKHKRMLREKGTNCRRKIFSSESSNGAYSSCSDGASNSSNECNDKDAAQETGILPAMTSGLALQTKFWAKTWDNFVIEWDQVWSQVIDKL